MNRFLSLLLLVGLLVCTAATSASANRINPDNPGYSFLHNSWNSDRNAYVMTTGNGAHAIVDSRLNALALQMHVRAAVDGQPTLLINPERVNQLVELLTKYPAFIDGEYTPYNNKMDSQAHTPGFTAGAGDAPGFQHVAVDPVLGMGLALAYHYRDQVGLTPENAEKAKYAVLRVAAHNIFNPKQIRMGQMVWTADMLWDKFLVDGDKAAFVRDYRRTLDYQYTLLPKLLSQYSSYHYSVWKDRHTAAGIANNMNSPEYSFITFQGAAYIHLAKQMGMQMRPGEESIYRRWAARLIWGEYGNNGYLNWDTGLGDHRRHITQYWGWTTLSLQRIASQLHGFITPRTENRAAALCNRAQKFFAYQVQTNNGVLPSVMYGVWNDFIGTTSDSSLGNARLLLALQTCPDGNRLSSARSFDPDNHRFAVTTTRYTTSVTPYARDSIRGFLPNKLVDKDGVPIGGLGGLATGFNFVAKGFSLNDILGRRYRWWMKAAPGNGPLTPSNNRFQARIALGAGKHTQRALINTRFARDSIIIQANMLRRITGYWRIPLTAGTWSTSYRQGNTVLSIVPTHGSPWQVVVPGRHPVTTVAATADKLDPLVVQTARIAVSRKTLRMTIHVG